VKTVNAKRDDFVRNMAFLPRNKNQRASSKAPTLTFPPHTNFTELERLNLRNSKRLDRRTGADKDNENCETQRTSRKRGQFGSHHGRFLLRQIKKTNRPKKAPPLLHPSKTKNRSPSRDPPRCDGAAPVSGATPFGLTYSSTLIRTNSRQERVGRSIGRRCRYSSRTQRPRAARRRSRSRTEELVVIAGRRAGRAISGGRTADYV
jgi:hypothetical protein